MLLSRVKFVYSVWNSWVFLLFMLKVFCAISVPFSRPVWYGTYTDFTTCQYTLHTHWSYALFLAMYLFCFLYKLFDIKYHNSAVDFKFGERALCLFLI